MAASYADALRHRVPGEIGPARLLWSSWYGWHTMRPDGTVVQIWHTTRGWIDYVPAKPARDDGEGYW